MDKQNFMTSSKNSRYVACLIFCMLWLLIFSGQTQVSAENDRDSRSKPSTAGSQPSFPSALANINGGTISLPVTGQTTKYHAGDDGTMHVGIAWPSPRFTSNADTTVLDNLSGLIWSPNSGAPTVGSCTGGKKTWSNALSYITCLNTNNYLGHADWRLPNINELESLYNAGFSEMACGASLCTTNAAWLISLGFSDVHADYYWSSTTQTYTDAGYAWIVHHEDGYMYGSAKSNSYYTWPVRGTTSQTAQIWKTGQTTTRESGDDGELQKGVDWPSPRFNDNGDGTITDYLTGLIWLKNANCFNGQKWAEALDAANTLNSGECGLSDGSLEGEWRLPNKKEYRSLINYGQQYISTWLNSQGFLNAQANNYWTSTTYPRNSALAEFFENEGYGQATTKTVHSYYVLPVRNPLLKFRIYLPTIIR